MMPTRPREVARRILAVVGLVLPLRTVQGLPTGALKTAGLFLLDLRFRYFHRSFVAAPTEYDFRVSGNTSDYIQRRLYVFGSWERPLSHWIASALRPGDVFVDIGANIGYFSLLASRIVGDHGTVIAYEALPSVANQLDRNVALNRAMNVEVRRQAVSDSTGTIEIFRGPVENSGESSTVAGPGFASEGAVDCARLDDSITPGTSVAGIKIDVEGDELRVLRGAPQVLAKMPEGSFVVTEVSPVRLAERGSSSEEVMDYMRGLGFEAYLMSNDYTTLDAAKHSKIPPPTRLLHSPTSQQDVLFRKTRLIPGR